jgi:phosphate transport system protein
MAQRFFDELEKLRSMVTALGKRVVSNVADAIRAFETGDLMLAEAVIGRDARINRAEVEVEKQCQHLLTLQQPVASDLRYVMSVLRIDIDLERIADQAVNIATQVTYLLSGTEERGDVPADVTTQAATVLGMVNDSLTALQESDTDLAESVRVRDDQVDQIYRQMHTHTADVILEQPERAAEMISYLKISHELERTADHAVNICEDVLFISEGEIARHTEP